MIAYVRGTLTEKEPTRVVLEAAGVGYELIIPLSTYELLPREGGEAKLLCFHSVREDDEVLYGFASEAEREYFRMLTSVSGVGPRIAIAVLSGMTIAELAVAISASDAKRLAAVKGVGKKTAEKICVELKDRVDPLAAASLRSGGASAADAAKASVLRDAVTALRALGFADEVSTKMVSDVLAREPGLADVEKIIKQALKSR